VRIDTHLHLYADPAQGAFETSAYPIDEYGAFDGVRYSARSGGVDEGLAALDEAGVDRAWVLGSFELPGLPHPPAGASHWPEPPAFAEFADDLLAYNLWLCDLARAEPRLLPFVTVNPAVVSARTAADQVDRLIRDKGARGLKLHPIAIRTYPDDPGLTAVFDVVQDAALPVVVHCGPDRRGFGWSLPGAVGAILDRHPRLPLVLAHLGGAAWRDLAAVADRYPQARFDLSEIVNWIGAPLAPSADRLVALIRRVGIDRVMTGSDFPWYDPVVTVSIVESLPGLAADDRASLLGEAAAKLHDGR
jgi:predicted TIM-barrel fold metal-dependent hydrolase